MAHRKPRSLTPEQVKSAADRAEGIAPDDAEQHATGGRPPDYKPELAEQAVKLCELGATDMELADFFGVTARTIYRWQIKYPAFCQALKTGKAAADERVERSLFHKAVGYTHDAVKIMQYEGSPVVVPYREHVPPDTTAAIFWLKNRRRDQWRDIQRIEHGEAGEFDRLSDAELRAEMAKESESLGLPVVTKKPNGKSNGTAH